MKKKYSRIGFIGFLVVIIIALALYFGLRTTANAPTRIEAPGSYTMAEVKAANSGDKCWAAISGSVYDLTSFAHANPSILPLCGTNATEAVAKLGKNSVDAFSTLRIGTLKD
jgi:cytochrome b involved in lipid metabolism